jgi:hypothetical protein
MEVFMRIDENTVIEETARAGVYRRRRLDLTERWLVDGVVTSGQHNAAVVFATYFDKANMRDRFSSLKLDRVDFGDQGVDQEHALDARNQIRDAMTILGESMGPVVWDVVGNARSLRDHVNRNTVRKLNVHEAKGRLIAGLDVLARHWKLN